MRKSVSGFTIVELLIVIVVIAILAAISVVAYTGIQNRTYDSAVQNDLKSLATKLEVYKVDNPGYPNSSTALESLDFKATKTAYQASGTDNNLYFCFITTDRSAYTITARSKSGSIYYASSANPTPRPASISWSGSANTDCNNAETSIATNTNYRGYAHDGGLWRAWVGGN